MFSGRGAGSSTYLGAAGNRPPLRLGHGQRAGGSVRFTELSCGDTEFPLN